MIFTKTQLNGDFHNIHNALSVLNYIQIYELSKYLVIELQLHPQHIHKKISILHPVISFFFSYEIGLQPWHNPSHDLTSFVFNQLSTYTNKRILWNLSIKRIFFFQTPYLAELREYALHGMTSDFQIVVLYNLIDDNALIEAFLITLHYYTFMLDTKIWLVYTQFIIRSITPSVGSILGNG